MNASVRQARSEDLESIVNVHMRAFRGFFLTMLGHRFLFELYRGFLCIRDGRLLVAEIDGVIAGFVAGTFDPKSFFRTLLVTRWFIFGWAAFGAALSRPKTVFPRLLGALWYRGEQPARDLVGALISAIAVDPRLGAAGIGTTLIRAFCDEAMRHGLDYVYLTTDRDGNESTNAFYRRNGFEIESQLQRADGRIMARYIRRLRFHTDECSESRTRLSE